MTPPHQHDPRWSSVPPVGNARGATIGTGIVVATHLVLTALHVVDPDASTDLVADGLPVQTVISLPTRRFGPARHLARSSYRRAHILTGHDDGTVDLALLAVPDLAGAPLPRRHTPVRTGELVTVPGYDRGGRIVNHGPITSADDADFVVHVPLGPGLSGAPVIDANGQLVGMVTMDHQTAGAIAIGPTLINAFLDRAPRLLVRRYRISR